MKVISDEVVAQLLDYKSVEDALVAAFADLAAGEATIALRHRIDAGPFKLSTMGGIWRTRNVAGTKSYATVDGNFSFLTMLFDLETNKPCAVFPGAELTRFRTAAICAMAARMLLNRPLRKVAIFGFGQQGRCAAEAIVRGLKPSLLSVVDPMVRKGAVSAFAASERVDAKLATAQEAVRHADLIVTATRSKTAVFNGDWLSPGASIIALGTSLPNGSELDVKTLSMCSRVIVEWKSQSMSEAGELALGQSSGAIAPDRVSDFLEMFSTSALWRRTEDEILLFKSVGIGLSDVAAAWLAYQRAAAVD